MRIGSACLLAALLMACDSSKTVPQPIAHAEAPFRFPAKPPEPPPGIKIQSEPSLQRAIAFAKSWMDDTYNRWSLGALLLAAWAAKDLPWNDPARGRWGWSALKQLPVTNFDRILKDPDEERGKLLCGGGVVIEIAAQKMPFGKVYAGGLADAEGAIVRFIATKSTGDIVAGSRAKFCGVVIGKNSYSNSAGGTAHAVQAVGMFDLPANW